LPAAAASISGVVGAGLGQDVNHRGVAVLAGDQQRRVAADAGGRLEVGAGVEQHLRELDVALLRRPVQRGHAVGLRGVDVGAVLEERAHRITVAVHRRVDERGGGPGGRVRQRRQAEREHRADRKPGRQRSSHVSSYAFGASVTITGLVLRSSAPVLSPKL
jgi:hypothetical protein